MYGASIFQVAADADDAMVQITQFNPECNQVGQGLGGVKMPAVASVDHRTVCCLRSCQDRAFDRVAHSDDVYITADNFQGICKRFPLGNRAGLRVVKPDYISAKAEHCGLKGHFGAGRRFIEESSQDFSFSGFGISGRVLADLNGEVNNFFPLFPSQITEIDQMIFSHK